MLTRRRFLLRTLKGSSVLAFGGVVPGFVARTAQAAQAGEDRILVIVEMTGGNDGLNTVVPYADDAYHKARPTLRVRPEAVVRINDTVGLHPGLRPLQPLLDKGQVAVVQGVGYPNPNRSHFESMDIWQSADPARRWGTGWLGRTLGGLAVHESAIPAIHLGREKLPLALQGSAIGVATIDPQSPLRLDLGGSISVPLATESSGGGTARASGPRSTPTPLIDEQPADRPGGNDLLGFVRRSALQSYATVEQLRQLLNDSAETNQFGRFSRGRGVQLGYQLSLVARMIQAGFGTRIFYVSLPGFDTHAEQQPTHQQLLEQVGGAINGFVSQLEQAKCADRVLVMTFSEFGRRVQENASRGTDHGAASCLFVVGPAAQGGLIGSHPSLTPDNLDNGDLKHHTDFRQVYATLLDRWLGCPSQDVLGARFAHVPLLKS